MATGGIPTLFQDLTVKEFRVSYGSEPDLGTATIILPLNYVPTRVLGLELLIACLPAAGSLRSTAN
jgi:hypothetical protein